MRTPQFATRFARVLALPLLVAGAAPVTAAARPTPVGPAASFTVSGTLGDVAATSASNAWAVGTTGSNAAAKTMIVRWNGTAWARVPTPTPAGGAYLSGVAATSATDAWAVGYAGSPGGAGVPGTNRPLILHWNGVAWKQVPTHLAPGLGNLRGVATTAAGNAWAVGCTGCFAVGAGDPLIERWNGTAWKQVPVPSSVSLAGLWGVAAASSANAWAVGTPSGGPGHTTGIVGWNGTAWKPVPSPNPGGQEHVFGVAATSARNAWAVGETEATTPFKGVISHWNGTAWN